MRGIGSLLGMLAATALILFLAWRASRWIALHGGPSGTGPSGWIPGGGYEAFRILFQLPVGPRERLLIVKIGEQCCLLAVTEHRIDLLKEWEGGEAAVWETRSPPEPPGFSDILKEFTRRSGKHGEQSNQRE